MNIAESRNGQSAVNFLKASAYVIYGAAVVYGDIMFLVLMQKVFPAGMMGWLAMFGAVATAMSCLILPIAKMKWFRNGNQMLASLIFVFIEFTILALNTILAGQVASQVAVEGFMLIWANINPATPVICASGWLIIFIFDEGSKRRLKEQEAEDDARDLFDKEYSLAIHSPEIQNILVMGARRQATQYVENKILEKLPQGDIIVSRANGNGHRTYEVTAEKPSSLKASRGERKS